MIVKTADQLARSLAHLSDCECVTMETANWPRLEAAARLELGLNAESLGVVA